MNLPLLVGDSSPCEFFSITIREIFFTYFGPKLTWALLPVLYAVRTSPTKHIGKSLGYCTGCDFFSGTFNGFSIKLGTCSQ